jgi:hypothetical protein
MFSTVKLSPNGAATIAFTMVPPPSLPNLRPFDMSFYTVTNLHITDAPHCEFNAIRFDVIVSPSKPHPPPLRSASRLSSANAADKHLTDSEWSKLGRSSKGAKNDSGEFVTGDDITGKLLDSGKVLFPFVVSPTGKWGNMFHTFLFGPKAKGNPLTFHTTLMQNLCTIELLTSQHLSESSTLPQHDGKPQINII